MEKTQLQMIEPKKKASISGRVNESLVLAFLTLSAGTAHAQATIPWQTPFENLIEWMSNDTAKWVLTLVIVGAGLAFAVGETGGFFRRCSGAVLGGAIAIQAATWAGALFGW